jgi:flavin reductase (DIM6/NTAB) family NADH-FMN oxidoreductase RutF
MPDCGMPVARNEFVSVMSAFPTGVAIVTTLEPDGTPRGLTTNAVTSVSAEPPILLVCVARNSRTLPALLHTKRFVVNFMRDDHAELCALFASKADDKFANVSWTPGAGGIPILHEGAIAHAECTTLEEHDVGDHVVVLGLVEGAAPPDPDEVPIVYFRKEYASAPAPAGDDII